MKRISKSEILEINETIESGADAKLFCDSPYRIERREQNGEIVWFGYNTNWKFFDNKWHILYSPNWKECDIPEYERLYIEMDIKKNRRLKLNNIENQK